MHSSDRDTGMGGSGDRFPGTHHSAVIATRSAEPHVRQRAFASLVASYWKPVYKYLRIKWSCTNEQAKDLTQAFFAHAMERDVFERYDSRKASFRTYLRTCLDGFASNDLKSQRRLKRGGGKLPLSLDFEAAEQEFRSYPPTKEADAAFEQEWVRSLFGLAVESLRDACQSAGKSVHYNLFERYDLAGDEASAKRSYAQLAVEFNLPVTQVTNYLAWVRREFRTHLLTKLRELTENEAEFRAEARRLLGDAVP